MENQEVVAKMCWALEEAAKGNVDTLDEIHDPDIVIHLYPFPDIRGLAVEKQSRLSAWKGFSDIHSEWEEIISQGDIIIARYTVRFKHTGINAQFQIPPTGKELILRGCFFAHQKKGKTVELFEYDDWLGLFQQLGLVTNSEEVK